jgi:hypothetical protein
MIEWLNLPALAGLAAAAGPIAVHLLRRQRAARLPFPSLRFVRAASTAAVRLRPPSDIWLLIVRVAIVCGAAAALAQPLFITPARRDAWDRRTSRAIVVDTSASMAHLSARAAEAAAAESRGAVHVVRVESDRLGDGLMRAAGALAGAPPSRREIVVISDFQLGSLIAADLAPIPARFGLRFVGVGPPAASGEFRGDVSLGAPGIPAREQQIKATAEGTLVQLTPAGATQTGLRILDSGPKVDALLRTVARAGAPAPSAGQPIALAFTTNPTNVSNPSNPTNPWMLSTLLKMRRDPALVDAARDHRPLKSAPGAPWAPVARGAGDAPVVLAAAAGAELVLLVAGDADDFLPAAALRSALVARRGAPGWDEHEVERIPAVQRAAWTRDAAGIEHAVPEESQHAPGDARWVWIGVLILLGMETLMRRRVRERRPEAQPHAA